MQMLRQSLFFGVCNYKEPLTVSISLITQHLQTKFPIVYSLRTPLSIPGREFFRLRLEAFINLVIFLCLILYTRKSRSIFI